MQSFRFLLIVPIALALAGCNESYELPDDGMINPASSTPYSSSYESSASMSSFSSSTSSMPGRAEAGCIIGGCSGQVCLNEGEEGIVTTCEWTEAYACYQTARCEKQSTGKCGWTKTPELTACLESAQ